ncbi:MAG: molybdate ABC transporter substrate-binding protein [Niameybacter sp.]|uniref:molybdate ABC transporter substrate-binding protein n=1 Tax=Niameybacter sp. TaxID=2033640 RepID=UPI002FCAF098
MRSIKRNDKVKRALCTGLLLVSTFLAGCAVQKASLPESEKIEPVELYVLAASSLSDVLSEVEAAYQTYAPEIELNFSFDASGTLARQIEEGAPADVFISAAMKQMNSLSQVGLVEAESVIKLLKNQIVLIQPKGYTPRLSGFEDVISEQVEMIAVGNENVPVGDYTKTLYERLGLWEEVLGKANLATSVRQVLDWVATENVDCGVVYQTDAAIEERVEVVAIADPLSTDEVIYPAGVIADSLHKQAAKDFLTFLKSKEANTLFEKYGFTPYSNQTENK